MWKWRWLVLACVCAGLAIAAPAGADVTIGPNPLPQRSGVAGEGGAKIFMTASAPGVMAGFLAPDKLTLRILRPTGAVNGFMAVGTSETHDVPEGGAGDPLDVYEFPTRLPIAAGDFIGLGTTAGDFPFRSAISASYLVRINPLADGQSAILSSGLFSDRYVLVNADVEPDCDRDGFGDETQDPVVGPLVACFAADLTAPDARLLVGPKKRVRTRKRRVPVIFRFNSDDSAASFECKLDKGAYSPCTSPKRYRIRATDHFKKHSFSVRARDAAGNVDPTPATRTFKVKRLA
jgi:hypothetical protein